MKKIFLFLSLLVINHGILSAEEITITTYYPSPHGTYDELSANKLAVDVNGVAVPTEYAAMNNGDVHIGRSLIIGVGGSGYSYKEAVAAATPPADGTLLVKNKVGIGTTDPGAKLEIAGSSDATQFIIKANSTQSNTKPLLQMQKSNGSLLLSLHSDSSSNIFLGVDAGKSNTIGGGWQGTENVFLGNAAGKSNTIGGQNVAVGRSALMANVAGDDNVAIGIGALERNLGSRNTAVGERALTAYTGSGNTAIGSLALNQTTGSGNTALGLYAGTALIAGTNNVFIGSVSGYKNISGNGNVFIGNYSGYNETGSSKLYIANSSVNPPLIYGDFATNRIGIGTDTPAARLHVHSSTGQGAMTISGKGGGAPVDDCLSALYLDDAVSTSLNAWVIAHMDKDSGPLGDDYFAIGRWDFAGNYKFGMGINGDGSLANFGGKIRWRGAAGSFQFNNWTFAPSPYLEVIPGGGAAYGISMWLSSKRYKEKIRDFELDSSKIYDLKPVSFNWKPEQGGQADWGMIAEDVVKIYPSLVNYDKEGKPFMIRYELLSILLLEELKKMQTEQVLQNSQLLELRNKVNRLEKILSDLTVKK